MDTAKDLNPRSPVPCIHQTRPDANENANETLEIEICRNFIRGRCLKGPKCKFRHELDLQYMTEVLKFCWDFQNRYGCTRNKCKYIHTTKEEESLFYTAGQIPRVLSESYARMAAAKETSPIAIQEGMVAPLPSSPPHIAAEDAETEVLLTEPDLGSELNI